MPYASLTTSDPAAHRSTNDSAARLPQMPADAALPYFDRILSDAKPLTPAAERELAHRIEDLLLERAAIVLGMPAVIGELQNAAARRLAEGSDAAESLRRCDTETFLARCSAAASQALERGRSNVGEADTVAAELLAVGRSITQHAGLKALSAASAASIDRYLSRLEGLPLPDPRPEPRGARLGAGGLPPDAAALLAERLGAIDASLKPLLDKFVTANLRLVRAVSRRINADPELRDDLIAEGHAALCRCAREFKASFGLRFSTYAFKSIRHAMLTALGEYRGARMVKTSPIDGSEKAVFCVSLHGPAAADPERETIEFVPDNSSPNPFTTAAENEEHALSARIVGAAMQQLCSADRRIISNLFGFDSHTPMTTTELAQELGLSRERLRGAISRICRQLGSDITAQDEAHLQSLGFLDSPDGRTQAPLASRRPPPRVEPLPSAADSNRRPPAAAEPQRAHLRPCGELFDAVDAYAGELNRIRKLSNTSSADAEARRRCLNELEDFHRAVSRRWPTGHSERRWGFALEGELLSLKQTLSTEQVAGIRLAMRSLDRRLSEL